MYPIFQWNAKYNWNFTYDKGFEQGDVAEKRAREFEFGRGTCIYFAVDFDATGADMDAVIDYFRGVRAALGRKNRYTYGIYGSRNVCSTVTRRVGATWSFVSGLSWGFSGNLGYPLPANWSFNQIRNGTFSYGSGSFGEAWEIDRNVWRRFSDPGTSVLNPARSPHRTSSTSSSACSRRPWSTTRQSTRTGSSACSSGRRSTATSPGA